jgi:hypothetical protein
MAISGMEAHTAGQNERPRASRQKTYPRQTSSSASPCRVRTPTSTTLALSRLYAIGGGTLWAPGLLHAAIDSFKLVVLPRAALPSFTVLIIGFSLVVPLLVLVAPASTTAPVKGT